MMERDEFETVNRIEDPQLICLPSDLVLGCGRAKRSTRLTSCGVDSPGSTLFRGASSALTRQHNCHPPPFHHHSRSRSGHP